MRSRRFYVQLLLLAGVNSAIAGQQTEDLASARALVQQNRFGEARDLLQSEIKQHNDSAEAHTLLGFVLFRLNDPKGSLAEYTAAARYRTPSAVDLKTVACDYVLLQDYPDAEHWLLYSLKLDPNDMQARYYLGRTLYNENRFDEAAAAFREVLSHDLHDVKAEDNLGLSLEGMGQTSEAKAAYRQALSWQETAANKDAGPSLDLGNLLLSEDHVTEALPFLQAAAQLAPSDPRTHRSLGKAYTHLNRLEEARTELEQAVSLAPAEAATHYVLAQLYRRMGLDEKARAESSQFTTLGRAAAKEK